MKVAVIGSRNLTVEDLGQYLPKETTEIVSGGAKGIDTCAREYANTKGLKLTEFLPEYNRYGRGAPLKTQFTDHRLRRRGTGVLGRTIERDEICHRAL